MGKLIAFPRPLVEFRDGTPEGRRKGEEGGRKGREGMQEGSEAKGHPTFVNRSPPLLCYFVSE